MWNGSPIHFYGETLESAFNKKESSQSNEFERYGKRGENIGP